VRQEATTPTPDLRLSSWIWPRSLRKRLLPDAGPALPGGVAKGGLVRRDRRALEQLVAETRRAELVHWCLWPFGIVTALWPPPAGGLLNLLFASLFNLPCLAVQRYNRLRLQTTLARFG